MEDVLVQLYLRLLGSIAVAVLLCGLARIKILRSLRYEYPFYVLLSYFLVFGALYDIALHYVIG